MGIRNRDEVKDFIPGTYVRAFDNKFYRGTDSLLIELISENSYRIINYGTYQRKADNKIQHEEEIWTCSYKSEDHLLYETRYGKVISFDPESHVLYVGGSRYQKN